MTTGRIAAATSENPALALPAAEDVAAAWSALELRTKKVIVDLLMSVKVMPAGKGVRFDPRSVALVWKGGVHE